MKVKLKRMLINGVLAATFALSAVAMESGAFSNLANTAFAAPAPSYSVVQSNPQGSTATVSGTYVWTTDVSFVIKVTGVNNGKITKVTVTTSNGLSQTSGNGSATLTSFPLFNSGLTMSFGPSTKNAINNSYSFTAKAPQSCDNKKTKCNGT